MSKNIRTPSRKRRLKLEMARGKPKRVAERELLMEKLINQSCEEHRAKLNRQKSGEKHGSKIL